MSTASQVLSSTEAQSLYSADSDLTYGDPELGKEDFLELLVAQLQYQDPLNPMDDKEFTAQLAQFSSLEQLTNMSESLTTLVENSSHSDLISASAYLGKTVTSSGSSISKSGDEVSGLYFSFDEAIQGGYINIFDSAGGLVRTEMLTSRQPGSYSYVWDGLDYNGEEMADGLYYVGLAMEDAEGGAVLVDTQVSGKVAGVQQYEDEYYLELEDGRMVLFSNVTEIVDPSVYTTASTTDTTEDATTTDDTTDSTEDSTTDDSAEDSSDDA